MRRACIAILLALLLPLASSAETWMSTEVTCPVCGMVNRFQVPGSYGTYLFRDPSRFEYVFWPATTDKVLYTCRECHLTAFMGDFEQIEPDKIEDLATMLKTDVMIDGQVEPYFEIPMAVRLSIAERVYRILGGHPAFWGTFYRIAGYHYELAGLDQKADAARTKALELAEQLAADETRPDRKESLVIVAAMRFQLGDPDGARRALTEASESTYRSPGGSADESQAKDRFLDELIKTFRTELLR
jgi:hypothetical protein